MSTLPAYVVDTSVVVKWYADEGGAEQAAAEGLLEALDQERCKLRAPELLPVELTNALLLSHKFSTSNVHSALNHFQELRIELARLSWGTLDKALELAANCGAAIYDSYFLALALETDSTLVTADEAFLRKVRHWPQIVALRTFQLPGLIP